MMLTFIPELAEELIPLFDDDDTNNDSDSGEYVEGQKSSRALHIDQDVSEETSIKRK